VCVCVCVCGLRWKKEKQDDVFYVNDKDSSGCITLHAFQQNEAEITPFQLIHSICCSKYKDFMKLRTRNTT